MTTEPEPGNVIGLPVETWHVDRVGAPVPEHDHLHTITIGAQRITILQAPEISPVEADRIAHLLGAARDLRIALAASRRALERADGVPCRAWLLSLVDAALAKAGGRTP
jgi:hypothetical protein